MSTGYANRAKFWLAVVSPLLSEVRAVALRGPCVPLAVWGPPPMQTHGLINRGGTFGGQSTSFKGGEATLHYFPSVSINTSPKSNVKDLPCVGENASRSF